ncbi:right-handed parallel beta-helix repeat-containing protein [Paenibacillus motobuensis]|uniref:right-handed parallel beta-helix repeat-containing protein n=1 Tax=Paenibacillus TaxID=44249 RepID=UPI002041D1A1|nr:MULTISPECIES: right-handed parallel beta-helix repeat-containing protein [Paenibacillus]MCM3041076.1 right-handed parallel beta-helix repeat-containing protein [Paenibacillus lutimineralis]MCM3648180.1 right-handed parallel beta-helix repeat-containing protein [Paenibacillus motobuensis]
MKGNEMRNSKSFIVLLIIMTFCYLIPASGSALAAEQTAPFTINVKDAGAKGDGIANDTEAFLSALETVAEKPGGGKVLVPEGTYLIDLDEPLRVESHVQVIGKGKPVLKFTRLSSSASFGYEAFWITGQHIRIDGIHIDGNHKLIRGIGVHTGSKDVTITNSSIKNITQSDDPKLPQYNALISGILIYGNTERITIQQSTITGISAIHSNPIARGILVWSEPEQPFARNVKIINNIFSHITPREDADAIYFDKTPAGTSRSDSLIQGNRIHHVAKRGIKIATPGVTVKDNHITNSYNGDNPYRFFPVQDPIPQDMFAAISVYASHVQVTNNTIDGVGSYYSAIEADMGSLTDIVIENNKISNGANTDLTDTNGIRLGSIRNFKIANNTISNMRSGIFSPISQSQSGIISNNTISNVEYGILFLAPTMSYTESKVQVKDNKIKANQARILSLANLD